MRMTKSHIIQPRLAGKKDFPANLPLLLRLKAKESPNVTLQASKDKKGIFQDSSYAKVYDEVITFALGLQSIGIERNTHVALISDNRKEWLISDLGILTLGAADVPRGTDSTGNEIRYIVSFAECSHGVFENMNQLKKVIEKVDEVPLLKTAIIFDNFTEENEKIAKDAGITLYSFEQVMAKGAEIGLDKKATIEAIADSITGDDLATIIFTSGTTGVPKGVMLTHRNYMVQLEVVHNALPCKEGDMWLSILPVWHSFERIVQYIIIAQNAGIAYSKPVGSIMLADMTVIKPQWVCGVPRIWEALAQAVFKAMRKDGGAKLALFNFFLGVGKRFTIAKEMVLGRVCRFSSHSRFLDFLKGIIPLILLSPLDALGNVLIFKKIRAKFGGKLCGAISGGGALQPNTDLFYRAIKVNMLEGYGITEAAPVLSVRHKDCPRPGCVGIVYPCSTLKVVAEKDGEIAGTDGLPPGKKGLILAKGDQIMKGYYRNEELTKTIIDEDGWLNTGDVGMLTLDNEIKITGRAKDTIVLLGGENIEPAAIESALSISNFIETSVVLGQDKKYLSALIVPQKDVVLDFAKTNDVIYDTYESLLETPEVINKMRSEIEAQIIEDAGFRNCDKIFKFTLLHESFKVSKELSAKQELMRHKINEIYKTEISKMFDE